MTAATVGGHRQRPALAQALATILTLALLAGCASGPRGGRDGPGTNPPSNLGSVPDAEPRVEAIRGSGGTSKPYTVLGRGYVPITDDRSWRESGLASWYGRQFHGQPTASGERYDMYAMTAAHKTLPLPSYVRVRNPANGREAILRVNDRGPFHDGRIIDLSYTAALKLDLLRGVAPVEIERITNDEIRSGAWRRGGDGSGEGGSALAAAPPRAAEPANRVPSAWVAPAVAAPGVAAPTTDARPDIVVAALAPLPPAASPTALPDAAPVPVAPPGLADAAPGFWVQLGAFREREAAEGLMTRAERGVPALATQLRVFSEAGTHRLQAGPFASRDAAGAAVVQVREGLRIAPLVVERR